MMNSLTMIVRGLSLICVLGVIIIFKPSLVLAQDKSKGLTYVIGFEYALNQPKTTITRLDTNDVVDVNSLAHTFKAKGGVTFLTYNFAYLTIGITAGGSNNVGASVFNNVVPVQDFDHDIKAQSFGLGYLVYFGKQSRRSLNFYGGAELAMISYSNEYGGGSLFDNASASMSITGTQVYGGVNYLLGTADFHLNLIFNAAKGPEDEKISNVSAPGDTETYVDNTDLSGVSLAFGILKYFQ